MNNSDNEVRADNGPSADPVGSAPDLPSTPSSSKGNQQPNPVATETGPSLVNVSRSLPQPLSLVLLLSAIFLSSVGAVLFTLAIFRLLSFFVMPSMFFALLLVGFPVGAAWAARRRDSDIARFRWALWILEASMALSVLMTLGCKHADYMRAHLLFGVEPGRLLMQVLAFALLYLPFFVAYGAAEYVGYLTGTLAFGDRLRPVYGVCLFGGAVAFAGTSFLQQPVGVARLLVVSIAAISLAKLILSPDRRLRAALETAALTALVCWPGFERTFMDAFKSSAPFSVAANLSAAPGSQVVFAGWGKYAYLEIVRQPEQSLNVFIGHYNDFNQWVSWGGTGGELPQAVKEMDLRDRVPDLFLPSGGNVAVVGSGGGREVHVARAAGARRILALEIEPGVVRALREELGDAFDHVYDKPPVEVYVGEARSYFEHHDEQFDLIMMMSVGGYPQMMVEPGNMIRTVRAFEVLVGHLTNQGVLAIGYDTALDPDGVLARQYYHTLRLHGLDTYAYHKPPGFLLLAFRRDASPEQKARWEQARQRLEPDAIPLSEEKMAMPDFRPITDDRPYLAGNIRNILSERQIWWMFSVVVGMLGSAGLCAGFLLHRSLVRRGCSVQPLALLGLGFLVGANFMLLEHVCVIQLFRYLYRYYDSLMIGIVAFLTLTGLGSFLMPNRWLRGVLIATLSLTTLGMWWYPGLDLRVAIPMLIPLVVTTGLFFPILFECVPEGRLALFGMDALGTAMGATLSFFLPMLFGMRSLIGVGLGMFLVTGLGLLVFLRKYSRPNRAESDTCQSPDRS